MRRIVLCGRKIETKFCQKGLNEGFYFSKVENRNQDHAILNTNTKWCDEAYAC